MTDRETKQRLDRLGAALNAGHKQLLHKRRNRLRVAGVAAAVALGTASFSAFGLSGGPRSPEPAAADVLIRAAQAAESFQPRELRANEYLYVKETVFKTVAAKLLKTGEPYYAKVRRSSENWIAIDYSGLAWDDYRDEVTFVTDADRAKWEQAGRPQIGQPDEYSYTSEIVYGPGSSFREQRWDAGQKGPLGRIAYYSLPEVEVTEEVLDSYDIEEQRLEELAGNSKRFNRYVRGQVAKVTRRLSKKNASKKALRRSTDRASFSLVTEVLAQPGGVSDGDLRGALLRLAATSDEIEVDVNARDPLGRPGISVKQATSAITFDPETFIVLSIGDNHPEVDPVALNEVPADVHFTTAIEYGIVDQLRQRPDGTFPPKADYEYKFDPSTGRPVAGPGQ